MEPSKQTQPGGPADALPKTRMGWKMGAVLAAVVALMGMFAYGLTLDPKLVISPLIGQPAPDFQVSQLGGPRTLRLSELRGRPVILNFWASWCVACREEAPLLQAAHTRYALKESRLHIVGIAIQDTPEKAQAFARAFGKTYFLALDNERGDIALSYGLYGVPETFFIDSAGVIRYKTIGPVTREEIDARLAALAGEPGKARP